MKPLSEQSGITWLDVTDSTNSELRRRCKELDNLSIIAAKCQTAGRGQGDHKWTSEDSANLTFSILYRFPDHSLPCADLLLITCVTTLAIRDLLLTEGVEARIKWHNDIWVGDRKICGMLIENSLDGQFIESSIVGIGLNLNQTQWPDYLPNPVSLKELTGRDYDLNDVLVRLRKEIRHRLSMLDTDDGRKSLQEEFGKYMFRLPESQR